jgi:hypothetical protein
VLGVSATGVVPRPAVAVRFAAYQLLPGTVDNRSLVTLAGAHPSAQIDADATDYNAAAQRLLHP